MISWATLKGIDFKKDTQKELKKKETNSETKSAGIKSIEIVSLYFNIAWNGKRIQEVNTQESQRLVMGN